MFAPKKQPARYSYSGESYQQLVPGETPPAGYCVALCRENLGGHASIYNQFVADGVWMTPETINGFFYRAADPKELERELRELWGT